jgi:hypothetical protein
MHLYTCMCCLVWIDLSVNINATDALHYSTGKNICLPVLLAEELFYFKMVDSSYLNKPPYELWRV